MTEQTEHCDKEYETETIMKHMETQKKQKHRHTSNTQLWEQIITLIKIIVLDKYC